MFVFVQMLDHFSLCFEIDTLGFTGGVFVCYVVLELHLVLAMSRISAANNSAISA